MSKKIKAKFAVGEKVNYEGQKWTVVGCEVGHDGDNGKVEYNLQWCNSGIDDLSKRICYIAEEFITPVKSGKTRKPMNYKAENLRLRKAIGAYLKANREMVCWMHEHLMDLADEQKAEYEALCEAEGDASNEIYFPGL